MADTFRVILADPPWAYRNATVRGGAQRHYPTLADPALRDLPVAELARDDSVLFLWATWPRIEFALEVMGLWGFRYKSGFPWLKLAAGPQFDLEGDLWLRFALGIGWWVRGVSEPILIGVRPGAKVPKRAPYGIGADREIAGLASLRFRHSGKPAGIHDLALHWPGPRVELFAREVRPGWAAWGNEIQSGIEWAGIEDWRDRWFV